MNDIDLYIEMELQIILERFKVSSIKELEELAKEMYGNVTIFFKNIDKIEIHALDLVEYGKKLLSYLPYEIRKYVAYDSYAEDYLHNNDKDYICKFDNIYIYPMQ